MILGYKNDKLELNKVRDLQSSLFTKVKSKDVYITDEYVLYNDNGNCKYLNKHLSSNNNSNDDDESVLMKFLNVLKDKDIGISRLFIGCTSLIVYIDKDKYIYMYSETIERIGFSITIKKVSMIMIIIMIIMIIIMIIIKISVSDDHMLILSNDLILYSCGYNSYGKLGINNDINRNYNQLMNVAVPDDEVVIDISTSVHHSAFITRNGKCYTFGSGHLFILGHGDYNDHKIPKLVEELVELNVVKISCGLMHTCCVTDNQDVYIWGVSVEKSNKKILGLPTRLELTETNISISSIISGSRYVAMLCQNYSKVIAIGQLGVYDYDSNDSDDNIKCRTVFETFQNNIISITPSQYEIGILLNS